MHNNDIFLHYQICQFTIQITLVTEILDKVQRVVAKQKNLLVLT